MMPGGYSGGETSKGRSSCVFLLAKVLMKLGTIFMPKEKHSRDRFPGKQKGGKRRWTSLTEKNLGTRGRAESGN